MTHLHKPMLAAAALFLLPLAAHAESGFYLSGSIGSASLEEDFDGFEVNDDVESYRLLAGWQLSDALGIEAGYLDFGTFEERIDFGGSTALTELSADGWTLGATLAAPLSEQFSVFGRAGIFVWDADVDVDGIREAVDDDSNPYYGAGAKFEFSPNLSLLGDWTRYELDDVDSDVISLGFEYRFGR